MPPLPDQIQQRPGHPLAMRNSAIRDHEAGRGTKMELDIFGTKHTTYFSPDGIAKSRLYSKFASSPLARRFLDESSGREILLLAELTRGPIWESSKGIAMRIKQPSPNHVAVSWLRSAYLMVFSLLGKGGYRYAESEANTADPGADPDEGTLLDAGDRAGEPGVSW